MFAGKIILVETRYYNIIGLHVWFCPNYRIVNMLNNHASLLDLSCTTAKMPDVRPVYIVQQHT